MDYCITDYHPAPDSPQADYTKAIQQAIDEAHAAGGGRVLVPSGLYPTASLTLRTNVELHLRHGAVLKAIPDPARYPSDDPDHKSPALLIASGQSNIALTGTGRIDGQGNSRRWGTEADPNEFRFSLLRFVDCSNVKIHHVGLYWTRWWAVHLLRCQDVHIHGCDIIARRDRINADGIDPDDCRRVRISDCRVCTGDDAIVIKSTSSGTCEDIVVSHCILESSCAAIKIGTETTGTIRDVLFSNCLIRDSNMGLAVYLKDGGTIRDITFTHCKVEASHDFPVLIDHTPRFYDESPTGILEGITIADCTIRAPGRLFIGGTPDAPIRGVSLREIDWFCTGPCPYGADVDRPTGAARVRQDPQREAVGTTPHHAVLHHLQNASITRFRLFDYPDNPEPRMPLHSFNCLNCDFDITDCSR